MISHFLRRIHCAKFHSGYLLRMQAIRVNEFGDPGVLKCQTVPMPTIEPTQVLVNVKAVGINPVETYIRSGSYARKPALPFTPGHDAAGVVADVGSSVQGFQKGDRVYTSRTESGSYAEFCVCSSAFVHHIPGSLSFSEAASLSTPYLTAYRALIEKGRGKPSHRVLVHGASGGVGVAATQFARAFGMTVYGTAGTEKGMEVVKTAGAHLVLNHKQEDYLGKLLEATEGQGVDVIIENAAHINLGKDLEILARGGCVAVVGSRGPVQVNPRDTMSREVSVVGVMLFGSTEEELKRAHAAIKAGAESGWLKPIVGKTFPLSQAADAHREIIEGQGATGKIVLECK